MLQDEEDEEERRKEGRQEGREGGVDCANKTTRIPTSQTRHFYKPNTMLLVLICLNCHDVGGTCLRILGCFVGFSVWKIENEYIERACEVSGPFVLFAFCFLQ